jgi:hypothetical protein
MQTRGGMSQERGTLTAFFLIYIKRLIYVFWSDGGTRYAVFRARETRLPRGRQ